MTANFIAKRIEHFYDLLDLEEMSKGWENIEKYDSSGYKTDKWINTQIKNKTFEKWSMCILLLEEYLRKNYTTFVETELVRKWAPKICEERIKLLNVHRAYGYYLPFNEWLKKNNNKMIFVNNKPFIVIR